MTLPNYLDAVRIPKGKSGDFEIKHTNTKAGVEFTTAPIRSMIFGGQVGERITYDKRTRWHQLLEDGSVWMTDLPCEQAQMRALLKGKKGHILIGGLGLGVAVNMAAAMPKITEITVVERSFDVIKLVAPHLRMNGKKVNVVNQGIMEFLKSIDAPGPERKSDYQCALMDTWAGDGQTTLFTEVIPILSLCSNVGIRNVSCWQEDVMRGQLRHSFLGIMTSKVSAFEVTVPTQAELHGEAQILYTFPHAVANDVAHPDTMEEATRMAADLARDFGVPGWTRHWKGVDKKLWLKWKGDCEDFIKKCEASGTRS